jgi:hypothetical protein
MTAPNAWLCRIQREDFETVPGSKVARHQMILAGPFQPPNHHPGITITPSTKTPHSQALPILEDLWFPSLF